MSTRTIGWILFAVLFLAWPLPLLGLGGSEVPAARYAQLGGALLLLIAIEGSGGMVGSLTALLWAHAIGYGLLILAFSMGLSRWGLARLPERIRPWLVVAMIVGLFLAAQLGGLYDTQFHHTRAHATLGELYR